MGRISSSSGAFVLVLAAACGGGGGGGGVTPPGGGGGGGGGGGTCPASTFCMAGTTFFTTPASSPPSQTVNSGATVSWQNGSNVLHNVTFANPSQAGAVGSGASGDIGNHNSGTNSRVFTAVGTHDFQCTIHAGMIGSVVVQ